MGLLFRMGIFQMGLFRMGLFRMGLLFRMGRLSVTLYFLISELLLIEINPVIPAAVHSLGLRK